MSCALPRRTSLALSAAITTQDVCRSMTMRWVSTRDEPARNGGNASPGISPSIGRITDRLRHRQAAAFGREREGDQPNGNPLP
jgi:hypothetical protein